jgi:KilA-N domain
LLPLVQFPCCANFLLIYPGSVSTMFIHDWNGKSITQLTSDTKISKFDIPAGYVNVTQMCGACGKLWGDYTRLESTKSYWDGLSRSMLISIDLLVISITTGKNEQRGTWAHPEIAILSRLQRIHYI